jgi:hypothetical protein
MDYKYIENGVQEYIMEYYYTENKVQLHKKRLQVHGKQITTIY